MKRYNESAKLVEKNKKEQDPAGKSKGSGLFSNSCRGIYVEKSAKIVEKRCTVTIAISAK